MASKAGVIGLADHSTWVALYAGLGLKIWFRMEHNGTTIEDTHAEAFGAWAVRLIVTAEDAGWAHTAAVEATGYGASVIGCDAEAGIERALAGDQTPDGRPGVAMLLFAREREALGRAARNRVGQCVLTCPTTAVFDGMGAVVGDPGGGLSGGAGATPTRIELGKQVRHFGDGYEQPKLMHERACWRVPVMDGWFVVEETVVAIRAIAGGNFMVCGVDQSGALAGARRGVEAIAAVPGVITPFPGGVVRSGSKVGSRYSHMVASTNHAYCPVLRSKVVSRVPGGVGCVYEIVIDGLTNQGVIDAMREGIRAACGEGVVMIAAGHYGGRLGKIRFDLHAVMGSGG